MQRPKSPRHVKAARSRWRAAEARAQAERDDGIPDRLPVTDARQPIELDLTSWGGPRLRIEPRLGYVAGRAIDEDSGEVLHVAALKEMLRWIAARQVPRRLGARNFR